MGNIMPEPLKHSKNYFGIPAISGGRISIPKPLKKRTPEVKRMTIAVGIIASDGIVIAADTEESYGSTAKISGNKILLRSSADGDMAISGSGNAYYIDAVAQELEDEFLKQPIDQLDRKSV